MCSKRDLVIKKRQCLIGPRPPVKQEVTARFMSTVTSLSPAAPAAQKVAFHRREMGPILDVYGRLVQSGQARDYAIGMYRDRAIFAIYRRASEQPTWRIEKVPARAARQGAYVVYGSAGQVLRRGHELKTALRAFDSRRFDVISG